MLLVYHKKPGNIDLVIQRNATAIKNIATETDMYFFPSHKISFKRKIKKLLADSTVYTSKDKKSFFKNSNIERYDVVYFEASLLGNLAKETKRKFPNAKVVTFFHNCELQYFKSVPIKGLKSSLLNKLRMKAVKKNENNAIKYSDKIIVLSERDKGKLYELYPKSTKAKSPEQVTIIPITLPNRLDKNDIKKMVSAPPGNPPLGIFLGSCSKTLDCINFASLQWFVNNIAPSVDAEFIIAGNDFSFAKNALECENVKVLGKQDDLKQLYLDADFIIAPILTGSGMKTKTCEAMMFGKTVFGTTEAFSGYGDIDFEKIGGLCNNPEEFINKINNFGGTGKFNEYSHNLYIENFSDQVVHEKFRKVFDL